MARRDDLDATRIRELLLDFYQKHDPQRLAAGLDVFSMVVWTQSNGLDALNDMLEHQYGARINPRKKMGGSQQAFARFSVMMAGAPAPSQSDAALRSHLRAKLFAFYEDNDPARSDRLPDYVDYIMLHGLDAFNRKLRQKYGRGIELDAGFAPPLPQDRTLPKAKGGSAHAQAPPPPPLSQFSGDDDEHVDVDLVPPPPPPPPEDAMAPEEQDRLEAQLRAFYAVHDPPKLEHIGAIMDWGLAIGAGPLESKLMQIYGAGFEDSDAGGGDDDDWGLADGPVDAGEQEDDEPYAPVPPPRPPAPARSTGLGSRLRASVRNVFGGGSAAPRANNNPQAPFPPPSARKPSFAGSAADSNFGGGAPGARAKPQAPRLPKPKKPSFSTGVQFEGLPKSAGAPEQPPPARKADWPPRGAARAKPAPPKAPSFTGSLGTGAMAQPRARPVKPAPPPGASRWGFADPAAGRADASAHDAGGEGPCGHYELDLTGAGFGMCKCGYPRMAHVKGSAEQRHAAEQRRAGAGGGGGARAKPTKPAKPTRARAPLGMEPRESTGSFLNKTTAASGGGKASKADFKAGGGEKGGDRACNNFRLDMTGNSYGVCECGFPRDKHNYRAQMEAEERKANQWGNGGGGGGGLFARISRGFR